MHTKIMSVFGMANTVF